jgi:hypothetical protein
MKNSVLAILFILFCSYKMSSQVINVYNLEKRGQTLVTITLDEKEIGSIREKSVFKYTLNKTGDVKLKIVMASIINGKNYPVGTPIVKNVTLEKGKDYNFGVKFGVMNISVNQLNEKNLSKLSKSKMKEVKKSE